MIDKLGMSVVYLLTGIDGTTNLERLTLIMKCNFKLSRKKIFICEEPTIARSVMLGVIDANRAFIQRKAEIVGRDERNQNGQYDHNKVTP